MATITYKAHYCLKGIDPFASKRDCELPENAIISKFIEVASLVSKEEIKRRAIEMMPPGYEFVGVEHASMSKQK